MLQQTQVVTVIPYYERFLARFPHVHALARASEEAVLRQWEGLGYYRRARQLHAAAKMVVTQFDGQFPTSIELVRQLPGIGRYTAGAILSIALDQRHPILEANTVRLFSRLLAYRGDPQSQAGRQRLWELAELLLPRRRVGDFNQALMELGSRVCTPKAPDCQRCPLAPCCPTRAAGLQEQIPQPKKKTAYLPVREAAVVVQAGDRILLRRCQAGERWEGMWDFPRFPVRHTRGKKLVLELQQGVHCLTGLKVTPHRHLATIRHAVTRFRITLSCHFAHCDQPGPSTDQLKWVAHGEATELPLSVTGRRIWQLLAEAD
jgi:A/G-specific adenine glycosylase